MALGSFWFPNGTCSAQQEAQIGHAMPAHGTAIHFKRSQYTNLSGIDSYLTAFREQHRRGQFAPRQTTPEHFAHPVGMAAQRLAAILSAAHYRVQVLIPEESELSEVVQPPLDQTTEERKIGHRASLADFAVLVQVENADVGQLGCFKPFVKIAGDPFQVRSSLPKAINPRRVEIDADESAGSQYAFAFQQVEGEQAGCAHQFAPIAAQAGAVAVLPKQGGGFTQDAKVAGAAGHFGGVVEGVVLAVGVWRHGKCLVFAPGQLVPCRENLIRSGSGGEKGRRTCPTSLRCIPFPFLGQALHQFQGFGFGMNFSKSSSLLRQPLPLLRGK